MGLVESIFKGELPVIEGSPITICRVCGDPYSSVVLSTCENCDRAAWELCQKIDNAKRIALEKAVDNDKVEMV